MKIKSLLFAALVAGMGFAANAETAYTNVGDKVYAEDVFLNAVDTVQWVDLYLDKVSAPDFTNIQLDIIFPDGIRPIFDEDMEGYGWAGSDCLNKRGAEIVVYSDNFFVDGTYTMPNGTTPNFYEYGSNPDGSGYPNTRIVGSNATKTAIKANPVQFYTLSLRMLPECPTGEYELLGRSLKYTCYNDDSYATADVQTICKINVYNPIDGVNEINVANAKTYKTIENGQVVIVKGDARYNTMGQVIK